MHDRSRHVKVTFDMKSVDVNRPEARRPKAPAEMPERIEKVLKSQPQLWNAFQKISPSHKRNYILWLSDAKNQRLLSAG